LIPETFDLVGQTATARSVYLALCEIASDQQNDTFAKPQGYIAARAGVSRETARTILDRLEAIGLCSITRRRRKGQKAHLESIYTLISPARGCQIIRQPLPNGLASLEESLSLKKQRSEAHAAHRSRRSRQAVAEELACYSEEEREVIEAYHRIVCDNDRSWRRVNKHEQSVCDVIEIFFTYDEDFEEFFHKMLAASRCGCEDEECEHCGAINIPRRDQSRTLVNVAWKNY
jgi:hypothetical protein